MSEIAPAPVAAFRIVIGEDQILLREGIAELLRADGFDVVGQAGDAKDLVPKGVARHPDVVITDVQMPPRNSSCGSFATIPRPPACR